MISVNGYKCKSVIAFVYEQVLGVEADKGELRTLKRQKREWIIPPKKLFENVDYTNEKFIAKVSIILQSLLIWTVITSLHSHFRNTFF